MSLDEVLEEGVLAPFGRARIPLDREHLLADERAEQPLELGFGESGEGGQALLREHLAQHGGVFEQPSLLGGEAVEPRRDQRLQRLGYLERLDRADRTVHAVFPFEQAPVEQHAHRLDRVERNALGTPRMLPRAARRAGRARAR